ATTVRGEDFRHLITLREQIGEHFAAGVVFFTGARPLSFGDRLMALPISLLWTGAAPPSTS
ncbi:MAG: ATP-binding protein, partial [Actinomycetes bacterium]